MHKEGHRIDNSPWLRAAVLGANDGIVSTASLLLGVASAHVSHATLLVTGVAGLVAGAMSMATGEYVSVSSQADTERAAMAEEQSELANDYAGELRELTGIYVSRGLEPALAREVAARLMAHDALGAHARDELGLSALSRARPLQAALTSAASFATGAALPLLVAILVSPGAAIVAIALSALLALALLGGVAAKTGGAPLLPGIRRITCWSALAMGLSVGAGALFGLHGG
ncbi:VIT family protein [Pantoea sp. 1.19]|uniref:VIT1/CCC1 transporter family protein n=1 Tax=Pantoea sp. 1.19 TaxID=1925589 RepID=UPI000948D81D|nr:VIT family protein [Pantoea sp. 1.19]